MANRKRGWKVEVDKDLPANYKLRRLSKIIKAEIQGIDRVEEIIAIGLLVRLWCAVMREEDSGELAGWTPEKIAHYVGWDGPDPQTLINALCECGMSSANLSAPGFLEKTENGYRIHEWAEWQNDPIGTRVKWAERQKRANPPKRSQGAPPEIGPKEECVRQILQHMSTAKIPGSAAQKREYATAWVERANVGAEKVVEMLMSPESRGQTIFWLDAQLGGRPAAQKSSSMVEELKKWAKGGPAPAKEA